MITENGKKQQSKKIKLHKTLKYLGWNCLIVLIGGSLVLNIIFIPKYYQNLNHQTSKTVVLEVKGESNQQPSPPLLWRNEITTTEVSLGDLLAQFPTTFITKVSKVNVGMGRFLTAFQYFNQQGNLIVLAMNNDYFWQILINQKPAAMGIDSTLLNNNTNYELLYKKL